MKRFLPLRNIRFKKHHWLSSLCLLIIVSLLLIGCASKIGVKNPTPIPGGSAASHWGSIAAMSIPTSPSPSGYISSSIKNDLRKAPTSLPSLDEEIWVISKSDSGDSANTGTNDLGTGALMTEINDHKVSLPLKHTDVKADLSDYIASVDVTQQFHNPYEHKIEAVYVFPLPHNAAVNEFVMTIGERRIRGIIRKREEAQEIYDVAKAHGYTASLLTQERPNIFTQSVANIEPGKQVDIFIKYFHTLTYDDGWYEFVFPMVVGPRFNPPGSRDGIGATQRGNPNASGQSTEVSYLKPGERSGHDIAVQVDIHAGIEPADLLCRSHVIAQKQVSDGQTTVTLNPNDSIPNKDFVLRFKVAEEKVKANWLSHQGEQGNYFTLMLYPPQELASLKRQPVELVFVLDCSGSMSGEPLTQAKAAISRALKQMLPDDTFQIIRFSSQASQLGRAPLPATPQNITKGLSYLASLDSEGGTVMVEGIKAALDFPHDPKRLRFVCFLTDGYIGNEVEILHEINHRLGASRIFSFGIGSSVNRYLMDVMAKEGRGAVAYLGLHESAVDIMDRFFQRISHPALTDIEIDWGGLQVSDVFPERIPDLFSGRPVILTGKYSGQASGSIKVRGGAEGKPMELRVPLKSATTLHAGLPAVWARFKIAALAESATADNSAALLDDITQVALDHNLMSALTSFVAVDASQKTAGKDFETVPVAVPVPAGVDPNTTVPNN